MTKERLKRLLNVYALYHQRSEMTDDQLIDYGALMDEFNGWNPDAIERERDEARTFAREVFQWADSYVPDSGWGEGWAEVIAWSKALDWLKVDK